MKLIDSQHTNLLSRAMDAYTLRQKAIASNVANINTPGYKKLEVPFEQELQKAAASSMGSQDIENVSFEMQQTGEDVLLEDEMLELADTQIRVQMVARSLRHSFQLMKQGITGRTQ
jgi:flagellar basal-body rod protein FlgB